MRVFTVVLTGLLSNAAALAQSPPSPVTPAPAARGPSLALALKAAHAALEACHAQGAHVSVSVVDSGGVLRILLADDGASKGAVTSSTGKALAAKDFKMPTSELAEKMKRDGDLAKRVLADPSYMPWSGALPLTVGGDVIGAIGVGGARGVNQDERCAQVGLEKIAKQLT